MHQDNGGDCNANKTIINWTIIGLLVSGNMLNQILKYFLPTQYLLQTQREEAIYWRYWKETEFGQYIELQEPNNCGISTVVMAFNIFFGGEANGNNLAEQIDRYWYRMPFRYRILPGFATTPRQQLRIANSIIEVGKLPVDAQLEKVDNLKIIEYLSEPKKLVIVTLGLWDPFTQPEITYRNQTYDYNKFNYIGSHTMIIVAYDPFHTDYDGKIKPWGVLCPWKKEAEGVFWLSDTDFFNNLHFPALVLTLLE